jgi:hypothetical protein
MTKILVLCVFRSGASSMRGGVWLLLVTPPLLGVARAGTHSLTGPLLRTHTNTHTHWLSTQLMSLFNLGMDHIENTLPGIPLLLSDLLSRLLPRDNLDLDDTGACFGYRGSLDTGRCLAVDVFSWSSISAFSCHVTIYLVLVSGHSLWGDAMHWKHKELKLGGGQAYDHSDD